MFIGGCAGSTACGIKIFRLQMLIIFLKNQIKKLISPNSVIVVKYNNQKITDDFIKSVITFIFSFLFIFLIIALLLSLTGLDFITAISGAARCFKMGVIFWNVTGKTRIICYFGFIFSLFLEKLNYGNL